MVGKNAVPVMRYCTSIQWLRRIKQGICKKMESAADKNDLSLRRPLLFAGGFAHGSGSRLAPLVLRRPVRQLAHSLCGGGAKPNLVFRHPGGQARQRIRPAEQDTVCNHSRRPSFGWLLSGQCLRAFYVLWFTDCPPIEHVVGHGAGKRHGLDVLVHRYTGRPFLPRRLQVCKRKESGHST